jgi:hypothetical protein
MRRYILAAALGALLLPLPAPAQYPPAPEEGPTAMVQDWYRRFLGRQADPQAAVWVDYIKQGQSPDQVLSQILASSEYYRRAGGTPQGFVQRLFTDLTGRPPSQQELNYWVNRVYQSGRQEVAYEVLQRYPQGMEPSPPAASGTYSPSVPGYDYPRYDYDYRRPDYRYRDWGRDRYRYRYRR